MSQVSRVMLLDASTIVVGLCALRLIYLRPVALDVQYVVAVITSATVVAVACVLAFYFNDLYDLSVIRTRRALARRFFTAVLVIALLVGVGGVALFPGSAIDGPAAAVLVAIVTCVLSVRALVYLRLWPRGAVERVLVVGSGVLAHTIVSEIEARPHLRYSVVGFVDESAAHDASSASSPVIGPLARLQSIVEETRAVRIVVALPERRGRLPVSQLLNCQAAGVRIEDGLALYEELTGKLAIEALTPSALLFSNVFVGSRVDRALTRAISLVGAVVALVVLTPLVGGIALAIKLTSRGPVLFVQDRVGLRGRSFRLLKFRTMRVEGGGRSLWSRDNGHRITPLGKWLRRFRLDELPQFINVVLGDMNLVGPRPHPVSNYGLFLDSIPYYFLRATVRPGITGWAQVRYGYANNLSEETEKMRYDLFYIKRRSLGIDVRILFDTVKMVVSGREGGDRVPRGGELAMPAIGAEARADVRPA